MASQRRRRVHPPQRPQEQAQRGALLVVDEPEAHGPVGRRRTRGRCVGAGQDHAVVGGEEALHELARRAEARGARVEAAEHELDDLAGDLGRQERLGRQVKGADVQRAGVAQGSARRRRRERLMDVADVERQDRQQVLDRARDVDGQRRRAPAVAGQVGQRVADREHARGRAGLGQQRRRIVPRGGERGARLAHRLGRARRGDDQDPVAARGELGGRPLDVARDLVVAGAPWIRGDVGDREAGGGLRIGEGRP